MPLSTLSQILIQRILKDMDELGERLINEDFNNTNDDESTLYHSLCLLVERNLKSLAKD